MRFLIALVCLCGVAVLANDEQFDAEVSSLVASKGWKNAIASVRPSVHTMGLALAADPAKYGIKQEVADAVNMTAELEGWFSDPNSPYELEFLDDDGNKVAASMSPSAPFSPVGPLTPGPIAPFINYVTDVKFHYFGKYDEKDVEGVHMTQENLEAVNKMWDPKLPLKVIVHGFTNTIKSPIIQMIKNAYLKTGKYNVIGVDWGALCKGPWYPGARLHVSGAGAQVGKMLDKLVSSKMTELGRIHIIGHSLGAHVAGIAGKSMVSGSPARITGLDPAGPLFVYTKPPGIIFHTDADLVDIIHTNAGFLGKSARLGNIDFYPNGGTWQVNCPLDVTGTCSHGRSYELFAQSILNGKGLNAFYCGHLPTRADNCLKERSEHAAEATMGDSVSFKRQGAYYVLFPRPTPFADASTK